MKSTLPLCAIAALVILPGLALAGTHHATTSQNNAAFTGQTTQVADNDSDDNDDDDSDQYGNDTDDNDSTYQGQNQDQDDNDDDDQDTDPD